MHYYAVQYSKQPNKLLVFLSQNAYFIQQNTILNAIKSTQFLYTFFPTGVDNLGHVHFTAYFIQYTVIINP